MSFSYSFHLSSKENAISTIEKISQASFHNLKDYQSDDYGKDEIQILEGGDNTILDSIKEIYHKEFDEALKKYNAGKRKDRQIDNYLNHISNSKADVGAEIIIQVGDHHFWKNTDKRDWKKLDGLFKNQLEEFKRLVPECKIASAIIHYDEMSPHMHIIGVPVSDGFKKGLEKQVSKTRVFTADRLSFLQDKMRENVELSMKDYPDMFQDVELEEREKGRNKDVPKALLGNFYQLEEENKKLKDEIAANREILDQQVSKIKKLDEINHFLDKEDRDPVIVRNYIIPEKKTFLGKIEIPEERGVFIKGMNEEQVHALIKKTNVKEELYKSFEDVQVKCYTTLKNAEAEAKRIRLEATAEKNKKIEQAQDVLNRKHEIIKKTMEWVENIKKKYTEMIDTMKELAGKKERLEKEIARIEPLKQEVDELTRAKQIMSGELDCELTKAKFEDSYHFGFNWNYDYYRKKGELLALYKDGSIRLVGSNENGGFDKKTLEDRQAGLCRVGIMVEEARVRVPKSVLKELIEVRDKDKPISQNLENLIKQQDDVNEIISKHKGLDSAV